jgi:hypothetical protein
MADTDASDQAYAAALEVIATARKDGDTIISFDAEPFRALNRIPPELAEVPGLTILDLDKTAITDLAPLAAMTRLQRLYLNQTDITDLAPLAGMTGLQTLSVDQTAITDLAPLAGMTGLQRLSLNKTAITDLAPLAGMTGLQSLFLDQTAITDLAPLAGMTGLQALFLDQTAITDLAPLAGMTGLQTLWLSQTAITDLALLAGMTRLQRLSLRGAKVSDLRPITTMTDLGTVPFGAIHFAGTPATARDPQLRALSEIEDDVTRTRETIAYLETLPPWPEPLPWDMPLTLAAVLKAQTPLGWRFSPTDGAMALFVEDLPLSAFQSQLASMATQRTADLLQKVAGANGGFRQEVAVEAKRFSDILADETRSLAQRSLELWGSLVALGSHLDANDAGRREGRHSADILSGEQRAALMTLLQIAGNLVRSFPDVQALDDSAGSFLRREVTIEMVVAMIEAALRSAFVTQGSGALMQHVAGVALVDGAQSGKAVSVSVRGMLNLITLATKVAGRGAGKLLGAAALGAAGFVGKGIAEHYELDEVAVAFIEQVKDQIPQFVESLPPDEAAQLNAAIEEMEGRLAVPKTGPQ